VNAGQPQIDRAVLAAVDAAGGLVTARAVSEATMLAVESVVRSLLRLVDRGLVTSTWSVPRLYQRAPYDVTVPEGYRLDRSAQTLVSERTYYDGTPVRLFIHGAPGARVLTDGGEILVRVGSDQRSALKRFAEQRGLGLLGEEFGAPAADEASIVRLVDFAIDAVEAYNLR